VDDALEVGGVDGLADLAEEAEDVVEPSFLSRTSSSRERPEM
jgi:hypothetical protein